MVKLIFVRPIRRAQFLGAVVAFPESCGMNSEI